MENMASDGLQMYRLWIATYEDWRPAHWSDVPPRATALEPVARSLYSAEEAAQFVEGFNGSMLGGDRPLWAVAVPITIRYEGDAEPGRTVRGCKLPLR
jgi:hypothetical protein